MGCARAHHSPLASACVPPLTLAPTFAGVLKHAKWFCKFEPSIAQALSSALCHYLTCFCSSL